MKDFTLKAYKSILQSLRSEGYKFQTFQQFLQNNQPPKTVVLRHDIDNHPNNALQIAKIEQELGIHSTCFFRIIQETFKPDIIKQIAELGHEIGYHYEDLSLAANSVGSRQDSVSSAQKAESSGQKALSSEQSTKKIKDKTRSRVGFPSRGLRGARRKQKDKNKHVETHGRASIKTSRRDNACIVSKILTPFLVSKIFRKKKYQQQNKEILIDHAYELFKHHLKQLRQYVPVKTICMHGSPKSKWDSKDIWQKYDYRNLGIIGEPYFDINFDEVFYLTDTGRRWDGWKVSLRDKVPQQKRWAKEGLVFHSTKEIIKAAHQNKLPNKIMITTHPERWTDRPVPWMKELVWQNVKNVVKYFLVKMSTVKRRV